MHLVHTIVLNFEHLLVFNAFAIGGHKTLKHLLPYMLLVHVGELLTNSFSPFSVSFFVAVIPGFLKCQGLILIRFDVIGHHGQID